MRFIVLFLAAIGIVTTATAATLYRWVDEQGRVHYSDRPQQGAETVEVQPAPGYSPPAAPASRPAVPRATTTASREAATAYQSVSISNPTEDQVLWNIGAVLTVSLSVTPQLQPGHRVIVRYDGAPVADWPAQALSHQVNEVYRGTHTIEAAITDENGVVLISGTPVTFHVKQTSILNRPR